MRHVLCAETDEERDAWVESLLLHVGKEDPNEQQEKEKEREKEKEKDKSGRKMPEIQKVGATPIKELASVKGNEKLLLNQEAYERQQRSIPPSPSAQQFHPQARNGMPMSPTTASMNMDDRSSIERQGDPSANRHPAYNQGNWNGEQDQSQRNGHPHQQQYQGQHQYQGSPGSQQQPQPPQQMSRNQSSHSLNQEEVSIFFFFFLETDVTETNYYIFCLLHSRWCTSQPPRTSPRSHSCLRMKLQRRSSDHA